MLGGDGGRGTSCFSEPKHATLSPDGHYNSGLGRSGSSVIQFAHLEHEDSKASWDGSELAYIGFDELQHLSETQFFYLLSRNRSTCGVRPRIRGTCNPSPNWLRRFLAPWVDKSFAHPAESGEVRYFVRIDGHIVWVDRDYVDDEGLGPKSMTFIRSTIYDNQVLLRADPGYLSSLKALHTADPHGGTPRYPPPQSNPPASPSKTSADQPQSNTASGRPPTHSAAQAPSTPAAESSTSAHATHPSHVPDRPHRQRTGETQTASRTPSRARQNTANASVDSPVETGRRMRQLD